MSVIYKLLIVIISGIGLFLNFKLLGIDYGLLYFTLLSNIFCFIFYFVTLFLKLFNKLKKNNIYYIFKSMMVMSMSITMILYYIMYINGNVGVYEGHFLVSSFLHLISPLMVIFDYIIFGKKGVTNKKYPFAWSMSLIIYCLLVIIYCMLGGTFGESKYPYDFMNIEKYGFMRVFLVNVFIYILFIVYGFFVQYFDHRISKK